MLASRRRSSVLHNTLLWASALVALACSKPQEVIVKTAAGEELTARDIDRAPLALLPPGGFAWSHLDFSRAAQSAAGGRLLDWAEARFPVPPSTGFVARRDLSRVVVAFYSMQGADFAGVASGRFDAERIGHAAQTQPVPGGATVTVSQYAGRTLYSIQNVGFVVLTPATLLFGNETGMRRVLDRIQAGQVSNELPPWVSQLLEAPQAHFVSGFDLASDPVTSSLAGRLKFLRGAHQARLLGNFEPPGINLAGTVSYADAAEAERGTRELLATGSTVNVAARLMGLGQPLSKLEARPVNADCEFVLSLDEPTLTRLLGLLDRITQR
jgi:hypothetical protein